MLQRPGVLLTLSILGCAASGCETSMPLDASMTSDARRIDAADLDTAGLDAGDLDTGPMRDAPRPDGGACTGDCDTITCGWGGDPYDCRRAGLRHPDGIEPGDPSVCEAPSGRRCYWVDADAAPGGDGSYAAPFRSFEVVVGHMEGDSYVAGLITGGDVLYVRGTFAASDHVEGVRNVDVHIARGVQCGTEADPTVIKSWRGSPRAVFDGEHVQNDLIRVRAVGAPCEAVRIENVEVTNAAGRGIYLDEGLLSGEIVGARVHDTIGDGNLGTGGGILVRATVGRVRHVVRECEVFSNHREPNVGSANNIGGISILSEPTAESGSSVTLFGNVVYDEVRAIRHKHSGNVEMALFANVIRDSVTGVYLRAFPGNDVHHNLFADLDEVVLVVPENQNGDARLSFHHNTAVDCGPLIGTDIGATSFARNVELYDNIYASDSATEVLVLGRYSGDVYDVSELTSDHNLFDVPMVTARFLVRPDPEVHDFDGAMTLLGDTTSFRGEPLFVDRAAGDYHLAAGSMARGRARDGGDLGALPAD